MKGHLLFERKFFLVLVFMYSFFEYKRTSFAVGVKLKFPPLGSNISCYLFHGLVVLLAKIVNGF